MSQGMWQPLKAGNSPELAASRKNRTSVLPLQRIELTTNQMSMKWVSPWSLQKGTQPADS